MGSAQRDLYAQNRRESGDQSERFLDLRIDLCRDAGGRKPGEIIESFGGRWDRRLKAYVDEAEAGVCFTLHDGQLPIGRWWADYCREYSAGRRLEVDVIYDVPSNDNARVTVAVKKKRRCRSLALAGGRRGGKTDIAIKMGVTFAVMVPGSRVWFVSESIPKTEELALELEALLPTGWYKALGAPWFTYKLPNGSVIWLRSAHDPEMLKRGRADLVILNEAQNMRQRAFVNCRGALADSAGLLIIAANPPDTAEGQWVAEHVEATMAHRRAAFYFLLDPRKNPYIDYEGLEDLALEVDERTFAIEVLGEFRPRNDLAMYAWSAQLAPVGNIAPTPELGCITPEFLKRYFPALDLEACLGLDFQRYPYPCAVAVDAFIPDPTDPLHRPRLWYTDETTVDEGDEADLSEALIMKGYDPTRTVLIADASAEFQDIERDPKKPKRSSFAILRALGWKHIYPPDPKMRRNPNVIERLKATNAMMKVAGQVMGLTGGQPLVVANPQGWSGRRLFSDPRNIQLNEALRKCPAKNGVPDRRSEYAHLIDGATYPIWRFFPRRAVPKATPRVEGIKREERQGGRRRDFEGI